MNKEKFRIIQFIRELILYIDKNLENFPKKDIELKNRIRNTSYDLLEISYEANSTMNIQLKKELLLKMIAKAKILDFLIDLCNEKEIVTNKKYIKFAEKLDDIVKYTTGWLKSIS